MTRSGVYCDMRYTTCAVYDRGDKMVILFKYIMNTNLCILVNVYIYIYIMPAITN